MENNMERLQEMIKEIIYDTELDMEINDMRNELPEMLGELAHFKKQQQQGRLLNLPCKPGDAVYLALYKEYYNDVYCKNEIRKCAFTPKCLDQNFKLKRGYFTSKEEAEGYILLRRKMDIVQPMLWDQTNTLAMMNFDERYDALNTLCHDVCKKLGEDILSAEFVEAVNDYLESMISNWSFVTLPADVQFESQAWEKMQEIHDKEANGEEQEK